MKMSNLILLRAIQEKKKIPWQPLMYKVPDFWVMFLPWGNSGVQEPLTKFTMGNCIAKALC